MKYSNEKLRDAEEEVRFFCRQLAKAVEEVNRAKKRLEQAIAAHNEIKNNMWRNGK